MQILKRTNVFTISTITNNIYYLYSVSPSIFKISSCQNLPNTYLTHILMKLFFFFPPWGKYFLHKVHWFCLEKNAN